MMAEQQKLTPPPPKPKITPAQQEAMDKETRKREEKAPTTKTEMGRLLKKGGYVRAADGIASRGKTKGRII
jgi:hypothetical protein